MHYKVQNSEKSRYYYRIFYILRLYMFLVSDGNEHDCKFNCFEIYFHCLCIFYSATTIKIK